jgi:hypothetical protein
MRPWQQLRSVAEFLVVRVFAASVALLFTAMTFDEPILPHASTDFANRISITDTQSFELADGRFSFFDWVAFTRCRYSLFLKLLRDQTNTVL